MTWVNGVDGSFDELTPEKAKALRAAGIEVFMQCLWTGSEQPVHRVTNLRNAQAAGFPFLIAYTSVTGSQSGAWHADQGRAGVPDDLWAALALVPIDVELPRIPNSAVRAAVDRYAELGKRRSIYTSYGQWTGSQGNATTFTDCMLFNAMWDNDPDIDFPRLPFGGWKVEQVVCEQYTPGQMIAGYFADRDMFSRELLEACMPQEQPPQATLVVPGVEELRGALAATNAIVEQQGKQITDLGTLLRLTLPKLASGDDAGARDILAYIAAEGGGGK